MDKSAVDILKDAMRLPVPERARIAAALLASLDGETEEDVEAAWAQEIEKRAERVRSGHAQGRPWSVVRESLDPPGH